MSFTVNRPDMELFHQRLTALAHPAPIQCVLRDALAHLCGQTGQFDACISADSPFYAEFFQTIQRHAVDADTCFAVLECSIIFCREKALQHDAALPLSPMESSLLTYFESSGQWQKNDNTLIQQWYWRILPQRHGAKVA